MLMTFAGLLFLQAALQPACVTSFDASELCVAYFRHDLDAAKGNLARGANASGRLETGVFVLHDQVGRLAFGMRRWTAARCMVEGNRFVDSDPQRSAELCRLLVQHGGSVDCSDFYGVTPLMMAARHGDATLVQLLLDFGADANRATIRSAIDGVSAETALHFAIRSDNATEICAILLDAGADPNLCNSHKQNARHFAGLLGKWSVVGQINENRMTP